MSMMTYIGGLIDKIFAKGVEKGNTVKGYLLAFVSGLIDGTMAFWAIFGLVFEASLPIVWLINKLKNRKT